MMNARTTGFVIAGLIFIADQLVKYLVAGPLGLLRIGDTLQVVSIFELKRVHNFGISLGLLQANSDLTRWGLVALTSIIAGGVVWWILRERNRQDIIGLGLVLGGAVGNIVDRIRLGYVLDYANLHFGDWSPFLVFNVADAAITIGVLVLVVRALFVRDAPGAPQTPLEKIDA